MRNKNTAVCLCMGFLLAAAGCGNLNADSDVSTVDIINLEDRIDFADASEGEGNRIPAQAGNAQVQANSELDGTIESIDENSVVINKTFLLSEDTAVSYAVSYGDSEKVLVNVYFSEETEFEVWTVKNGGVNGDADVEKRQGAFSDLGQGANINMTGYYDENDFHAKHVILYNFV